MIVVLVPIRLYSESNMSGHWSKRAKRTAAVRDAVGLCLRAALRGWSPLATTNELPISTKLVVGLRVTMVRLAPRLLDDDNLAAACKAVRDQVALEIGLPVTGWSLNHKRLVADDRDPRVTWVCKQERAKEYGVRIEIEEVQS